MFSGLSAEAFEALPGTKRWIDPEVGGQSKAEVIAFYRLHNLMEAVIQDAATSRRR